MIAAENVQRQITVAAVVALEKLAGLDIVVTNTGVPPAELSAKSRRNNGC